MSQVAVDRMTSATSKPRRFFIGMAILILIVVGVGFSRTFYLASVVGGPEAVEQRSGQPWYILAHGVVLTIWFLLFFVQTILIAGKRVRLHRTLGMMGVAVAAALVALTTYVVYKSPARFEARGTPLAEYSIIVIGNFAILALFVGYFATAVVRRKSPVVHKRMMTLASICLLAPALARWPGAAAYIPISAIGPQLALCVAMLVHDKLSIGKVQRASGWGVACYLAVIGVAVPFASTEMGRALVRSLG